MKAVKFVTKGIICILIIAFLVLPLGLIYEISQREMEEYSTPQIPQFRESAYGEVVQAQRVDMDETVIVSGQFRSYTYGFMELEQRYPDRIRWLVNVGQEIQEGQVLGTYRGEDVISTMSGILESIDSYGQEPYLKVKLLTPVELECSVGQKELILLQEAETLTAKDGTAVALTYVASVKNTDGTTTVRLSLEQSNHSVGDSVKDLTLLTGRSFTKTLVLPEGCLYQKSSGEDNPWYVRNVTSSGVLIKEMEVSRGYSSGGLVCVTGVNEGDWFDSGYKQVLAGDDK